MKRVAIPALIVLVVVAAYVSAAAWNRSAEPRQTLVVTERELPLWTRADNDDDPGLRLQLLIAHRPDPFDAQNWLSESRLRQIGFAMDVPPGAPAAADTYDNVPGRLAWIVLEFDGPVSRDLERRRALTNAPGVWRGRPEASKLVPVDAGLDREALVAKYPSGYLVLRGIIQLAYLGPASKGPLLYGWLSDLVPHEVSVPRHLRPVLDRLGPSGTHPDDSPTPPRYEVELAVGPLGVPYIRSLRLLTP